MSNYYRIKLSIGKQEDGLWRVDAQWWIPGTKLTTQIQRPRGEVPKGTLHRILKGLGLSEDDLASA